MMGGMDASVAAIADYVDRAVDAMSAIVLDLGDDLANQRPDLPGANSPYVILRHCLGVMDWWAGQVVAGREVVRDRPAEFRARGEAAPLVTAAEAAKRQFRVDVEYAEPAAPPVGAHPAKGKGDLEFVSQAHTLCHVLEEVTQHLGQLEITRDLLRASGGAQHA